MGNRLRTLPNKGGLKHPGGGYRKCVCDICAAYVRRMDCQLIDDPLAYLQQGMLVCKWCKDDYNPQLKTKHVVEEQITDPGSVRPDPYYDDNGIER